LTNQAVLYETPEVVQPQRDYCAYRHFSFMLDRTGTDWLLGRFEVYFDDSGTHAESPIAIAACYVSVKRGWDDFVKAWDDVRYTEGFDVFHMADFAAREKPFDGWDQDKRQRVYRRLAAIINENKRAGFAMAVPRDVYDRLVSPQPEWLRNRFGRFHYTFAVRCVMGEIANWRYESAIKLPMEYTFDRQSQGRGEISAMWDAIGKHESWTATYGMERDGFAFRNKAEFKPLQAADILAWQMNHHMRHVIVAGKGELEHTHPNFRILREDQEMRLFFITEEQLQRMIERELAANRGPLV